MKGKRGIESEILIYWLIAIAVLILIVVIIVQNKESVAGAISRFKDLLRFGR